MNKKLLPLFLIALGIISALVTKDLTATVMMLFIAIPNLIINSPDE